MLDLQSFLFVLKHDKTLLKLMPKLLMHQPVQERIGQLYCLDPIVLGHFFPMTIEYRLF